MHDIEPFYSWRLLYTAEEDERSPFYGKEYSEFEFTNSIYNYFIHPQWDGFGSATLYLKILYADYDLHFCIIELIGEWNDCIYNDVMYLKRNVIEYLIEQGITKFILIGENVLDFHASDTDYYQEWFEEIDDGWIVCINFRNHVIHEIEQANIDYYLAVGGRFNEIPWRAHSPSALYTIVEQLITKRLQA
jgi:hypothetical protein